MNPLKHETFLNRRECWADTQAFRFLTSQVLLWFSDVMGVEETGGGIIPGGPAGVRGVEGAAAGLPGRAKQ